MAPGRSPERPESGAGLSPALRERLADAAWRALAAAARGAPPPAVGPTTGLLAAPRASFVTLHRGGELRGCVGSLTARRTLLDDVAANARAAALDDRRFPPLAAAELAGLTVEISILSPLEPLAVSSRAELVAHLRPGRDGLVLEEGRRRATFLPAVWEQLSEAERFVAELERKAELAPGWSPARRAARYTVESFAAPAPRGGV